MRIPTLLTTQNLRPLLVVGVVLLLALGFLGDSIARLIRLRDDVGRTREAVVRQQGLLRELQEELRNGNSDRFEDQFRKFAAQLPEDTAGVRGWLTEVQCLASNRHLLVSPTWGDAEVLSGPLGRFERIQVTLEIRPEKEVASAKTAAVIRWLRDLNLDQPPWELNRLHLSGTNQSLALAVVAGNLWIRSTEPSMP